MTNLAWLGVPDDIARLRSVSVAAKVFIGKRRREQATPLTKAAIKTEMTKLWEEWQFDPREAVHRD